ncbi:MAG: ABC transporter permease subunit, partial [Lachnospiraceae bacterium]|nr:ABC transporter permease subunit [Lachnospiraceae bacterium]
APESIAGEKERGTLATILATPARRRDMALAKVLSVTIFGVLGAGVTFLGMMLSLPNIMDSDVNLMASYGAGDYLMILLVIISTVLVFISLLSVMSAYAKSVKEANSYATPFMIVSMVLGLSSLFTGGAVESFYYYLIPVFNTAQGLTGLFTGAVSVINITVTVMANIAFSLILVGLLAKMFSSERIIFDK